MSDIPDVFLTWNTAKHPLATGGRDLIACAMFVPAGRGKTEICGHHLAVTFENPLALIAKIAEHARTVKHAHVRLPENPPSFAPARVITQISKSLFDPATMTFVSEDDAELGLWTVRMDEETFEALAAITHGRTA